MSRLDRYVSIRAVYGINIKMAILIAHASIEPVAGNIYMRLLGVARRGLISTTSGFAPDPQTAQKKSTYLTT